MLWNITIACATFNQLRKQTFLHSPISAQSTYVAILKHAMPTFLPILEFNLQVDFLDARACFPVALKLP